MSTSWLWRSVLSVNVFTPDEALERAARGGRGRRVDSLVSHGLPGEEVLDAHDVALRARHDVEERRHGRDLLALLLEEPVHELLGDEVSLLPRGDRELLDLAGDPL